MPIREKKIIWGHTKYISRTRTQAPINISLFSEAPSSFQEFSILPFQPDWCSRTSRYKNNLLLKFFLSFSPRKFPRETTLLKSFSSFTPDNCDYVWMNGSVSSLLMTTTEQTLDSGGPPLVTLFKISTLHVPLGSEFHSRCVPVEFQPRKRRGELFGDLARKVASAFYRILPSCTLINALYTSLSSLAALVKHSSANITCCAPTKISSQLTDSLQQTRHCLPLIGLRSVLNF